MAISRCLPGRCAGSGAPVLWTPAENSTPRWRSDLTALTAPWAGKKGEGGSDRSDWGGGVGKNGPDRSVLMSLELIVLALLRDSEWCKQPVN